MDRKVQLMETMKAPVSSYTKLTVILIGTGSLFIEFSCFSSTIRLVHWALCMIWSQ